jgi:hypothetical protein
MRWLRMRDVVAREMLSKKGIRYPSSAYCSSTGRNGGRGLVAGNGLRDVHWRISGVGDGEMDEVAARLGRVRVGEWISWDINGSRGSGNDGRPTKSLQCLPCKSEVSSVLSTEQT